MKINGKKRLNKAKAKHADARKPLDRWLQTVEAAEWRSSSDVAQTFGRKVDRIRHEGYVWFIFDIGGNKYRLQTTIVFELSEVNVIRFMTHEEYDHDTWKDG